MLQTSPGAEGNSTLSVDVSPQSSSRVRKAEKYTNENFREKWQVKEMGGEIGQTASLRVDDCSEGKELKSQCSCPRKGTGSVLK